MTAHEEKRYKPFSGLTNSFSSIYCTKALDKLNPDLDKDGKISRLERANQVFETALYPPVYVVDIVSSTTLDIVMIPYAIYTREKQGELCKITDCTCGQMESSLWVQ